MYKIHKPRDDNTAVKRLRCMFEGLTIRQALVKMHIEWEWSEQMMAKMLGVPRTIVSRLLIFYRVSYNQYLWNDYTKGSCAIEYGRMYTNYKGVPDWMIKPLAYGLLRREYFKWEYAKGSQANRDKMKKESEETE